MEVQHQEFAQAFTDAVTKLQLAKHSVLAGLPTSNQHRPAPSVALPATNSCRVPARAVAVAAQFLGVGVGPVVRGRCSLGWVDQKRFGSEGHGREVGRILRPAWPCSCLLWRWRDPTQLFGRRQGGLGLVEAVLGLA